MQSKIRIIKKELMYGILICITLFHMCLQLLWIIFKKFDIEKKYIGMKEYNNCKFPKTFLFGYAFKNYIQIYIFIIIKKKKKKKKNFFYLETAKINNIFI